jgi:hypothetical protein
MEDIEKDEYEKDKIIIEAFTDLEYIKAGPINFLRSYKIHFIRH